MRIKMVYSKNVFTAQEVKFYRRLVGESLKSMGKGKNWCSVFRVDLKRRAGRMRFRMGGYGYFDKPHICLKLPQGILCHNELVHLIRHEIYHTQGLRHKDMNTEAMHTCYCSKFYTVDTYYEKNY